MEETTAELFRQRRQLYDRLERPHRLVPEGRIVTELLG